MMQKIVRLKVRPFSVAVLVSEAATQEEVVDVLKFSSSVWGGKYFPLISVKPKHPDAMSRRWLSEIRPDFVYGAGVDHLVWLPVVEQECQPLAFGRISASIVSGNDSPMEGHVTPSYVLRKIFRLPVESRWPLRQLNLVNCSPTHQLAALLMA